jgi:hypothetical protein
MYGQLGLLTQPLRQPSQPGAAPTAVTRLVRESMATTHGSQTRIPRPRT